MHNVQYYFYHVALIPLVIIHEQKTKDCAPLQTSQHNLQHFHVYLRCLPAFITSLLSPLSMFMFKPFNSERHETLRSENDKFAGLTQTSSSLHFFPLFTQSSEHE